MDLDFIDTQLKELHRQYLSLERTVGKNRLETLTIEQRKRQIQAKIAHYDQQRLKFINVKNTQKSNGSSMDTTEDILTTQQRPKSFSLDDEMVDSFKQNELDEFLDEDSHNSGSTQSFPSHYPQLPQTNFQNTYPQPQTSPNTTQKQLPFHLQHVAAEAKKKQENVNNNNNGQKFRRRPLSMSLLQPITNTTPSIYPSISQSVNTYVHPQQQLQQQVRPTKDYSKIHQELDQISETASLLKSILDADSDNKRDKERLLKDLMDTVSKSKERLAALIGEIVDEDPRLMDRAMSINEELHSAINQYHRTHDSNPSIPSRLGSFVTNVITDYFVEKSPRKTNSAPQETTKTTPPRATKKSKKNPPQEPSQPPPPLPQPVPQPVDEVEYQDSELFMEDSCYPKLTEHEMEDFDDVLDKYEEEIEEEDIQPQFIPPTFLNVHSPDTSTASTDSSIGPAFHVLAQLKPELESHSRKKKRRQKPRSKIVVVAPPDRNKPSLRGIYDKHKSTILADKEPTNLRDRVHNLLDTMRQKEDEIVQDDEDRELDQLEGDVMDEDEEEFDEDDDEEVEEDEEETKLRLQQEELLVEEELKELERAVERDRKLEKASTSKQVRFIDMPYFANDFRYLERELALTDRKKRILELFFYKILKQRQEGKHNPNEEQEDRVVDESRIKHEGKLIITYESGKRVIVNAWNRSIKVFLPNGHIIVRYRNGDLKRIVPRDRVEHFYKRTGLFHVLLQDKSHLYFNLSMRACEKKYNVDRPPLDMPDDVRGLVAKIAIYREGQKVLTFTNGAKEIINRNVRKVVPAPSQNANKAE